MSFLLILSKITTIKMCAFVSKKVTYFDERKDGIMIMVAEKVLYIEGYDPSATNINIQIWLGQRI